MDDSSQGQEIFDTLEPEVESRLVLADSENLFEKIGNLDAFKNPRVDTMRRLIDQIPTNELGLPRYIYRADLIPPNLFDEATYSINERYEVIASATLDLDYFEGFPSQIDGTAFWAKLFYEPLQAYRAFVEYLGVVTREDDSGHLTAPVRTLTATSRILGIPESKLREYSFLFYWRERAKAHDMFMVANFQKTKETRAIILEDSHYKKASSMLSKVEKLFEEIIGDEDRTFDVSPKDALDMLIKLTTLQRISVGLPAAGPSASAIPNAPGSSLENQMRRIASAAGEQSDDKMEGADTVEEMLNDPETLAKMQEMIIKAHKK